MRDTAYELQAARQTLQEPLTAWFFLVPGSSKSEVVSGQYDSYFVQLQCDSEDLIHLCYDVGSKGVISFTQPVNNKVLDGWTYKIRPPLPFVDLPGNLLFEVKRRKGDTEEITAPKLPKLGSEGIQVWAYPQSSDLAGRRLVAQVSHTLFIYTTIYPPQPFATLPALTTKPTGRRLPTNRPARIHMFPPLPTSVGGLSAGTASSMPWKRSRHSIQIPSRGLVP